MKIKSNILFILIVSLISLNCSNDDKIENPDMEPVIASLEAVKTFGGSQNDSAQAIEVTQDEGYVILGYTLSNDGDINDKETEDSDFYLLKFNETGILQWSKTYGGTGDDRGFDILENADGSFVVLGYSDSSDGDVDMNQGNKDYWVLKLSSSGTIIWQKSFGYLGEDFGTSIIKSSQGGYLLTGVLDVVGSNGEGDTTRTSTRVHDGGDYWAIKITENGDIEWSKYFGGSNADTPKDVVQTDDGGYMIIGDSDSVDIDITGNKGFYDFWIVKISSTGILEWQKSYGGTNIDTGSSIVKTNDGNYVIVGSVKSNDVDVTVNKGGGDLWIAKISPSGDLISEKSIGGTKFDTAEKIISANDGNYIIAGASRSEDGDLTLNQGQIDGWIVKIDSDANIVWQVSAGGSKFDYIYDVAEFNDSAIIAVGDTYSIDGSVQENKGSSDIFTVKIK